METNLTLEEVRLICNALLAVSPEDARRTKTATYKLAYKLIEEAGFQEDVSEEDNDTITDMQNTVAQTLADDESDTVSEDLGGTPGGLRMSNGIACRKLLQATNLLKEVIEARPKYNFIHDLTKLMHCIDEESMGFDIEDGELNDE